MRCSFETESRYRICAISKAISLLFHWNKRDSLVLYCFSRYADASSVLMKSGETIYTGVTINPEDYLPLDNNQSTYARTTTAEIQDRNIYIVGSLVGIGDDTYSVYVVEDITTVYNSIASMITTFILVSVICVFIGAVITALLIRRSTRPVTQLAEVSGRIADGEYSMRADIKTKDEIGELAGDFNRMAEAVESHIAELTETAERQRLFIGGVTHEFKTPLTALLLHSRMLRRAYMTEEEKDNSLEHIEKQTAYLLKSSLKRKYPEIFPKMYISKCSLNTRRKKNY